MVEGVYGFNQPKWAKKQIMRETGLVENICEHGVGHPSRESAKQIAAKYMHSVDTWLTHGCCGCCSPAAKKKIKELYG